MYVTWLWDVFWQTVLLKEYEACGVAVLVWETILIGQFIVLPEILYD